MVGNPGDVRAVVLDPAAGALAGLRRGGVLVDCTSSSPSLAREVAAAVAGCHAVDAPVSGGVLADCTSSSSSLAITELSGAFLKRGEGERSCEAAAAVSTTLGRESSRDLTALGR